MDVWRKLTEWWTRPANKPLLYYVALFLWAGVTSGLMAGTAALATSPTATPAASALFALFVTLPLLAGVTHVLQSCARHTAAWEPQPQMIVVETDGPL
jgi:hypothetical protein